MRVGTERQGYYMKLMSYAIGVKVYTPSKLHEKYSKDFYRFTLKTCGINKLFILLSIMFFLVNVPLD